MDDLVTPTEPLPTAAPDAIAALFDGDRPEPHNMAQCQRAMLPVHEVLAQISGKWTILVVRVLSDGPKRFSEIKRQIEGVSQKMLTATLRDLEKDGFVSRKVTPSIPPRVDYALTEMGEELQEPLRVIGNWAHANRHRVVEARERFAEREEEAKRLAW
ncbi:MULTISPECIES: helix-turn-helix domain-containing protein [unclassified Devosia]|jgi:DNA-binding HxlR family transcriptional regulator|uniref:winged helix-turn-helix transcriptional regulator n=1 Tax=unclassified Devosia TaxID=196773 RepID=UPI000A3DE7E9|nr:MULTISPECIES: helix-turn-helix domain-containing protein [unclassified Devosia]